MNLFSSIINQIFSFFENTNYVGIFILMVLESTLIPIPSEVVIPPAAYLASKGTLSLSGVITSGTLGSLAGSLINYFIALKLGRPAFFYFVGKYGKYLLITTNSIYKIENFWKNHGNISIFIGRLLPGFRHIISIPAGFAKMNIFWFSFFTTIGAGIWCGFLGFCGYFFGKNEILLKKYLYKGTTGIIIFCCILVIFYVKIKILRESKSK